MYHMYMYKLCVCLRSPKSSHSSDAIYTYLSTRTHTKIPPLEEATKEHRETLQQELARVIKTANSDSTLYVAVAADTHPEVATCEKAIEDMLAHEQKTREDEVQRQREEEVKEACTNKLLIQLRAAREKVRMCVLACMSTCIRVYVFI